MIEFVIKLIDLSQLNEGLKKLPEGHITMILADAENYLTVNIHTLKYLCNIRDMPGIYITVNRPYHSISKILLENKIRIDRLFFIDCITIQAMGEVKREDKCLFVSPGDLTDLAVSIDQWVEAIPEKDKFLFMDSLSSLLFYNSAGTLAKFSHFLTGRMRLWDLSGIFMSLEKEDDPHFLDDISQFCDEIITIKGAKE
ncbi:MAG: hypothetical protein DRO76_01035 [Candidatus Altiarchaeales archaeon]|nr:MAG: hypothetical protein DRO76_01035 [Candidatus Altiarchaeales archaeon]